MNYTWIITKGKGDSRKNIDNRIWIDYKLKKLLNNFIYGNKKGRREARGEARIFRN